MSVERKCCLEPLIDDNSRILILGTLPGDKSISLDEYYADPSNEFWKVIYTALGFPYHNSILYGDKKALLKRYHIALWDLTLPCQKAWDSFPPPPPRRLASEVLHDVHERKFGRVSPYFIFIAARYVFLRAEYSLPR